MCKNVQIISDEIAMFMTPRTKGPMQRPHPGLKCSDRIANSFVGLAVVTVINVGRTFSTD